MWDPEEVELAVLFGGERLSKVDTRDINIGLLVIVVNGALDDKA